MAIQACRGPNHRSPANQWEIVLWFFNLRHFIPFRTDETNLPRTQMYKMPDMCAFMERLGADTILDRN